MSSNGIYLNCSALKIIPQVAVSSGQYVSHYVVLPIWRHELWLLPNAALVISLLGENSEYNRLRNLIIAWLVLSAVTDMLVSGTLIHYLVGLLLRSHHVCLIVASSIVGPKNWNSCYG